MTEETKPRKKRVRNPGGVNGRPSILSEAVQAEFFANRALGISIEKSANLAGVNPTSVRNWRLIGEEAMKIPAGKRSAHQQKCVNFVTALTRIDDEWLKRCEIVLNLAMSPGQTENRWKDASPEEKRIATDAAKFKLTHQASHEYSTRQEISGPEGSSLMAIASGEDVYEMLVKIRDAERLQPDE